MRVVEKAGLQFEGIHKAEWFRDGQFFDSHMYAIVHPDLEIDRD